MQLGLENGKESYISISAIRGFEGIQGEFKGNSRGIQGEFRGIQGGFKGDSRGIREGFEGDSRGFKGNSRGINPVGVTLW